MIVADLIYLLRDFPPEAPIRLEGVFPESVELDEDGEVVITEYDRER